MNHIQIKNTLLLSLFLLLFNLSYSITETISSSTKTGGNIDGCTISTWTTGYASLTPITPTSANIVESKLYAKLWFEDGSKSYYANDWRITVSYTLTPETQQQPIMPGVAGSLTINYSKNSPYTDIDYSKLDPPTGEHFIKGDLSNVVVLYEKLIGSTWITQSPSSVPSDIHFELVLESEFYYDFDFSAPVLNSPPPYDASLNELTLSWGYVQGAELYELEILAIDLGRDLGTALEPEYNYDFKDAIRISTNLQHYKLPMAFTESFLLFRVRAIQQIKGINEKYKRDEGHWSSPLRKGVIKQTTGWNYPQNHGVVQPYHWTDPSNLLKGKTWQYSVTYAEEGKSAQGIVFYDGLMSPRQNVTVSNTNDVAIVGEQIKDFIGRPAVSIMPSPIQSQGIRYYDGVNINSSSTDYDYSNFDINTNYNNPEALSPSLSLGSANYYSSNRTLQGVNSDYIPEANGYSFTRTQFTRDGTNRPVTQSGVGTPHKTGSGKETFYFYGTTNRQELDRLFGNNVGFEDKYKKNMVVDPNGQASVSYVDGNGRRIATALSGSSSNGGSEGEGNVDIDSKPENPVPITCFLNESNKVEDGKVISAKTILVQQAQVLTFNYDINPTAFGDLCFTGDCYYDLKIFVTNDRTGNIVQLTPTGGSIGNTITEIKFKTKSIEFTGNFSEIGTYHITKELSLNQEKLTDYYDYIISTNNPDNTTQTCYPFQSPILLTDCEDNCIANCYSSYVVVNSNGDSLFYNNDGTLVGSKVFVSAGNYIETPITPPTGEETYFQIRQLLNDCRLDCAVEDEASPCDVRLSQLIDDMSPGGQYFDNHPAIGTTNYSTIGINGWLTNIQSTISPNIFDATYTTWDQVRSNWKPEWEDIAVLAHPEYCALQSYCCVSETTVSGTPSYQKLASANELDPPGVPIGSTDCNFIPQIATPSGNHYIQKLNDVRSRFLKVGTTYYPLAQVVSPTSAVFTVAAVGQATWDLYHHSTTGVIGTGTGQMTAQEFIDKQLIILAEKAKYRVAENHCGLFPLASVSPVVNPQDYFTTPDGFTIRFPKMDWNPTIPSVADKTANCKIACDNMAQQWIDDFRCFSQLDEATHGDQTRFKQALIDICKGSCDNTQEPDDVTSPSISFYVKGVLRTATSFAGVFHEYRNAYGLQEGACQTSKIPEDIQVENCGCDAVLDFAVTHTGLDYWNLPTNYSGFSAVTTVDLMLTLFNISSDPDSYNYDQVYNHCIKDPVLSNLSPKVDLPSDLDCYTPPVDDKGNPLSYNLPDPCNQLISGLNAEKMYWAKFTYREMVKKKAEEWSEAYQKKCIDNALATEIFKYTYLLNEYHYTLYYYDQAGNLVQTVSPEGVYQRNAAGTLFDETADLATKYTQSKDHRSDETLPFVHPDYAMHTNYVYNSLNQLTEQTSPDGGSSYFFYDNLGRLQASQNAEQATRNAYSYTDYDGLGRIIEVGELSNLVPLTDDISRSKTGNVTTDWDAWFNSASASRNQIVTTYYDDEPFFYEYIPTGLSTILPLKNTRNRITSVAYWNNVSQLTIAPAGAATPRPASASYYSYDVNGNVHKLIQENSSLTSIHINQRYKVIDYDYDLISGNVTKVDYQLDNVEERFSHKYTYDADNRLTVAYSSRNGVIWEKESKNIYYLHGPLARTELGDKQVQAQDYAYTLQGWLKAVNSSMGHKERDMGEDGNGGLNENFGTDAYGYSLHYFDNDYITTGAGANPDMIASYIGSDFDNENHDLFNGNISKMIVGLTRHDQSHAHVMGNTYTYDQLNRIKEYTPFSVQDENTTAIFNENTFSPAGSPTINHRYASSYSYDGNGNINTLNRFGSEIVLADPDNPSGGYVHMPLEMDNFNYFYNKIGAIGQVKTDNKLYKVTDEPGNAPNYGNDLDGQTDNENYVYDEIGRLKEDKLEGIDDIQWNVANKIKQITKSSGVDIYFTYDAMGNRITKKVETPSGITTTFYIRDAQGNVLTTYKNEIEHAISKDLFSLSDFHIYGSSRLGTRPEGLPLIDNGSQLLSGLDQTYRKLGNKRYELSNHLGNVLEVISDRKLVGSHYGTSIDYYTANVISFSDYYPFGMLMPNRHTGNSEYRYSFNGMEKDNEIAGDGNSFTTQFRQYDPRIARWTSIDPVTHEHMSPYNAFDGNPIYYADPSGADSEGGGDTDPPPSDPSPGDVFATPNGSGYSSPKGHMLTFLKNGNVLFQGEKPTTYLLGHSGEINSAGRAMWRVIGFEYEDGTSYIWNDEKQYFVNESGEEYKDSWTYKLTNGIGLGTVAPVVNMATSIAKGENPFAGLVKEWGDYEGTMVGFAASKVKEGIVHTYGEISAGGHRRSMALYGLWGGVASSGGPFSYGAISNTFKYNKGRVFYVGEGAMDFAVDYAKRNGMMTIYDTWYGKAGNFVTPYLSQTNSRYMWGKMSYVYSSYARSPAVTIFGTHRSTGLYTLPFNSKSAWKTIEFPNLYRNNIDWTPVFTPSKF